MTRSQYDELSKRLVRLMNDMEDELLHLIAEQLARDGNFSDTSKWRIRQLARAGMVDKKAAALVAKYTEIQSALLVEAVENAAYMEMGYVDAAVRDLQRQGLLAGVPELPAEKSAHEAYKAYLRQAQSDLNMVNTVMRYKTKAAFVGAVNGAFFNARQSQRVHDALDKYTATLVGGHMSLQEASRKCIQQLSRDGIPAFVDRRGHEWSPETYVTMDLRSTLGNTARAAQDMRCDKYGFNLIQVSSHLGARPLCAPYQGRIFSRDGTSGVTTDGAGQEIRYTPLSETSYGEPAGLFGINCGHVQYPFTAGCSFQRYFPYDEEKNAERYKEFQKQRHMERQIRATKRECMMYDAAGDKEGFEKASVRLKNQKTAYRDYSSTHNLNLHNDRTQVVGFDRSVSSKAIWAQRKSAAGSLTNNSNSGTIKPYEIKKTRAERKALIEKSNSLDRPIFAVDTDDNKFASYASRIPKKDGFYDVALHGNATSAEFFGEQIDAYTLAGIIKSRPDYKIGTPVRLLSCSTGNIDNTGDCFAQLLANELKTNVEAPTQKIHVLPNGEFEIFNDETGEVGYMKPFWSRK